MADDLILQFGYFGIFLVLVLGGLGLPVPEEAPIIVAAILSRKGTMSVVPALAACFTGVLVGDFVVYFLGFFYGEKVLSFPLTRKFLTKAREEQIKGYFHRHGVKILIIGRFAVGFRTAAYLTAGILRLPTLKLFLTDLCAASFSTLLVFGLSYKVRQPGRGGVQGGQALHHAGPRLDPHGLAPQPLPQGPPPPRQAGRPAGPDRGRGQHPAGRRGPPRPPADGPGRPVRRGLPRPGLAAHPGRLPRARPLRLAPPGALARVAPLTIPRMDPPR